MLPRGSAIDSTIRRTHGLGDLVRRAQAGDDDAFAQLYERALPRVYGAVRALSDTHAAADITQDCFLRAYQRLDQLQEPEAFLAWVVRIARNLAADRLRREGRVTSQDTMNTADVEAALGRAGGRIREDPVREAEVTETRALVEEAAEGLGEKDRRVLRMQVGEGLTNTEIASALGIGPKHANVVVARMRRRVLESLRARSLWRGGEPRCSELRELVGTDTDAPPEFDRAVVRLIRGHVSHCHTCRIEQQRRMDQVRLLGLAPLGLRPVPRLVRTRLAGALTRKGVPVRPSCRARPVSRTRTRTAAVLVGSGLLWALATPPPVPLAGGVRPSPVPAPFDVPAVQPAVASASVADLRTTPPPLAPARAPAPVREPAAETAVRERAAAVPTTAHRQARRVTARRARRDAPGVRRRPPTRPAPPTRGYATVSVSVAPAVPATPSDRDAGRGTPAPSRPRDG